MSLQSGYLLAYNTISLTLWAYLLWRTLSTAPALFTQDRLQDLYPAVASPLLAGTQSLAFLEIVHAASGLVRASPLTTALQVIGKNLVVWTVMMRFPELIVGSSGEGATGMWPFLGCVVFWAISEIVRYGYFVVLLMTTGATPEPLKWLRYSAFIVLYPPGILSEAALVYLALTRASDISLAYRIYLLLGFLAYIPASYILYAHMLSQRKRVLR